MQSEDTKPVIQIQNLVKTYSEVRAVDGLDLEVLPGEIFGFLGPNGAGKTTTIRILTGLTKPTSGKVFLNGLDVVSGSEAIKKAFGIVQQHLSLDRELTVWEILEFHARLHHIGRHERRDRIAELIDYVELTEHIEKRINQLSGGLKRRVMIARALIHRPRILFLDEPTVGLDAQTRRRIWALIRRMNADGMTVFVTTHYIEEAQELCDRVGIIHRGKLIALGGILELRQRLGMITVEAMADDRLEYRFFPDMDSATAFVRNGMPAESKLIAVRESNLEDIFVEMTGRKVGGGAA